MPSTHTCIHLYIISHGFEYTFLATWWTNTLQISRTLWEHLKCNILCNSYLLSKKYITKINRLNLNSIWLQWKYKQNCHAKIIYIYIYMVSAAEFTTGLDALNHNGYYELNILLRYLELRFLFIFDLVYIILKCLTFLNIWYISIYLHAVNTI